MMSKSSTASTRPASSASARVSKAARTASWPDPDGDLYVGGIGSTGDWQQNGTKWYGLQKLRWNGDVPFEMLHVRPGRTDGGHGIEIEFTKPLAEGHGTTPRGYRLRQWTYEPTSDYGGPKIDLRDLRIDGVTVSPDRRGVYLQLAEDTPLREGYVVHVTLRDTGEDTIRGENDALPWSTEAWYTLNKLPTRAASFAVEPGAKGAGDDGRKRLRNAIRRHRRKCPAELARLQARRHSRAMAGERRHPDAHRRRRGRSRHNRHLRELRPAPRMEHRRGSGNSGVIYGIAEEGPHTGATYETGLEMQVLDDERHPDGRTNGRDRLAGALYDLVDVPDPSPVKPAGEWNHVRIVVNNGRIEHYLNGEKIVDLRKGSPDWQQRLAASKFADWPRFAQVDDGHIGLQDHGDGRPLPRHPREAAGLTLR